MYKNKIVRRIVKKIHNMKNRRKYNLKSLSYLRCNKSKLRPMINITFKSQRNPKH